jgi:dipeptidyl aminopeptidase/acylaminoacyl peptidase
MLSLLLAGLLLQPPALAPAAPAPAPVAAAPAPAAPVQPAAPATPPPATDIYELAFDGALDKLRDARPQPIATERGYENQPFFTPDGEAIWFTANRDGKQTDIYEFNRKTRRTRRLGASPEGEYSAAITPDGNGFSVIRVEADGTQRLWRFDRNGANPTVVLKDIKPVGYHAWIDGDQLALFVLGQPATLQHAKVSTGKATVVASGIGRSLHRIPGTALVSFIHREAKDSVWVKQFDPAGGGVTPLVRIADSNERDVAWLPDGTLLMAAGTKIFAWRRGDKDWREVYDVSRHNLGAVTRMAAAPDGRTLAIVITETTILK